MNYEILDGEAVINTIVADAEFMAQAYPDGNYRSAPELPQFGPSEKELAAHELAAIDAETGMSRTMRESLLAIADKVAAPLPYLAAKEAAAAAAREKLKP